MKSWWVKLLLGLGAILLVLLVWLSTSGIRSKNAVDQYKDQLRAAGEKLSIDQLLPPRADPDKNGAALFHDAGRYMSPHSGVVYTNTPPEMRMVAPGKAMVGWRQAEILSPEGPGFITNTWADLEQDLGHQGSALDLLEKASERPQLDFELDYRAGPNIQLTHLMKMKEAAMLLSAAAISDLNRGEVASSVSDIHTSLALVNSWKEPLLISHLVRIAMAAIAASAQWDVLQATNLTDGKLAELQSDWQAMEFIRSMEKAFEVERVWGSLSIQQLRGSNSPSSIVYVFPGASPSTPSSGDWLDDLKDLGQSAKRKTSDSLWRISWSYSDELHVLQENQVMIETVRQIQTNGFFKDALAERDRKIHALGLDGPSDNWLRNQLEDDLWGSLVGSVGSLGHSIDRTLGIEATRQVVITAIALKRYQLRHAALPSTLSALVPEFLSVVPRDPVDGKPLRYRLNPDGTFLLYSIGSDGTDNGGDPTPTGSSKTFYWQRGRDWVWPQPATAQEVQDYYDNPPK